MSDKNTQPLEGYHLFSATSFSKLSLPCSFFLFSPVGCPQQLLGAFSPKRTGLLRSQTISFVFLAIAIIGAELDPIAQYSSSEYPGSPNTRRGHVTEMKPTCP